MKKEKDGLEQLLNSLIERGWCPRWEDKIHSCRYYDEEKKFKADYTRAWIPQVLYRSIRELCSREAGLWQFVCDREHRFIDERNYDGVILDKRLKNPYVDYDGVNTEYEWITGLDYKYRLIESSLKDESELEDFLFSNIKVDAI